MISNHLSMVEQQRKSAEAISAQVAQYMAAGGQISQLKSPPQSTATAPLYSDRPRHDTQAKTQGSITE